MKAMSAPLLALFASSDAFCKADLYTITLADSTVIRTTDADSDITFGGVTWTTTAPMIMRTKVKTLIGVEVDTMNLDIAPATGQLLSGVPWAASVLNGALDGATILVETAYWTTFPTIIGKIHTFQGLVSDAWPGRSLIKLDVKSALELLTQPFPRNLYQGTCLRTLYSAGCNVSKAAFTVTSTISGGASVTGCATALGQAAEYFAQGVLTFTSGVNLNVRRTIKSFSGGAFVFVNPLSVAPSVGDTISVYPGCDKRQVTCDTKFSNRSRFRGFPYIPTPETTF